MNRDKSLQTISPVKLEPNPGLFSRRDDRVVRVTVEEDPVFDVGGHHLTVSRNIPHQQRELIIRQLKTYSIMEGLGLAMAWGTFFTIAVVGLGCCLAIVILAAKL